MATVGDALSTIGPFGRHGELPWNDGVFTTVRQIEIHYDTRINSIQFEYDLNGESQWSDIHGAATDNPNVGQHYTVRLNYPEEFLVVFFGHYTNDNDGGIRSLTFQSNKQTFTTCGRAQGPAFSSFPICRKINGFLGSSCSTHVNSIGACFDPNPHIPIGLFGGDGGIQWDDGMHTGVRQLAIYCDSNMVYAIQIEYDDNGKEIWSSKHGTNPSGEREVVKLDYPSEYITSISGYLSTVSGHHVVTSLSIKTNKRSDITYGEEKGMFFQSPDINGKIIGFRGRSGELVASIGAYLGPLSSGPFGGEGGHPWDDGIHARVTTLRVTSNDTVVSIQVEYDNYGKTEWGEKHGTSTGGHNKEIKLVPEEYITSVGGYYGTLLGVKVVRYLIIKTNKGERCKIGKHVPGDVHFELESPNAKIIGFFGKSAGLLDSIGAYYQSPAV